MDRHRWGWVALFVVLSGVPVLLAALFPPEGWRFVGGIVSPDDASVYVAAMHQGERGMWLYHPPFDPSPVAPLLMHALYVFLGKVAGLFQANLTLIYHLARLASGLTILGVAIRWTHALFETRSHRTTAWLLVAFSSGLGWLLSAIPSPAVYANLPDLRLPEASTFLAAFAAPHFALGVALEAASLLAFWRATEGRRWALWSAGSGLALVGLGLTYPFTLPVVYGTMGAYVAWALWRSGRSGGWRSLRAALVAGGIALPLVIYYARVFLFDPFWRGTHVAQNVIPTPGLGWLVAGYGLPLVLAVWGGVTVWRENESSGPWGVLTLWALLNGLVLYLPVTFQWRLANGWHFALALLASRGLIEGAVPWLAQRGAVRALRRSSPRPRETVRRVALILTVPSTLMVVLLGTRIALTERGFPYYMPERELQAMGELAGEVSFEDVVLGAYPTGNVLPSRALCRVVVGQQFATLDPEGKLEDVVGFFDEGTTEEERWAILTEYGVTVVYYGRWERMLGHFEPREATYLREWSRTGETVVYRVVANH
jgi:hypothetical protein